MPITCFVDTYEQLFISVLVNSEGIYYGSSVKALLFLPLTAVSSGYL